MKSETLVTKLFGLSKETYNTWRGESEKEPIISLLDSYFTKEELIEFLESGEISRLEQEQNLNQQIERLERLLDKLERYTNKKQSNKNKIMSPETIEMLSNYTNTKKGSILKPHIDDIKTLLEHNATHESIIKYLMEQKSIKTTSSNLSAFIKRHIKGQK